MDADLRLHLANDRIAEAQRIAAEDRLAAMAASRDAKPRPPRGPLGWLVRAGATGASALVGIIVLRLA